MCNDTPTVAVQLLNLCATVPDRRREHRRQHPLPSILIIALMGFLCGYTQWVQIAQWASLRRNFLASFLDLPHGTPSHDTFTRVFAQLRPEHVEQFFQEALALLAERLQLKLDGQIAIDGKAMKGTRNSRTNKLVHVVGAWATQHGLTLACETVDEKSNEITAIPELLKRLNLQGNLVSIDAMGCQKEIAEQICEQGGDYFLAVKGNQGRLHEDVQEMATQAIENGYANLSTFFQEQKSHGRQETRFAFVLDDLTGIRDAQLWPKLSRVIVVTSDRHEDGKDLSEVRYYISSRELTAEAGLTASRNHWGIENRCHWVLDVLWCEDDCRNKNPREAENMTRMRRFALNILRTADMKEKTITGRQLTLQHSDDEMIRILQNSTG